MKKPKKPRRAAFTLAPTVAPVAALMQVLKFERIGRQLAQAPAPVKPEAKD